MTNIRCEVYECIHNVDGQCSNDNIDILKDKSCNGFLTKEEFFNS